MNPELSKRRHHESLQHSAELRQTQEHQAGREFSSVEDLIRHDAENTHAPPVIAERLAESLAQEPKRRRSWWQRLFSPRPE